MIKDIDSLSQPIINIYSQIELDLIKEIARRFDLNDEIGGTMEWQLKKLDELGVLNADTVKVIASYSEKSEQEILNMLKKAQLANINMTELEEAYRHGSITVDPMNIKTNSAFTEVLELSYKELSNTYRLIQTKALESAKQAYMNVINRSYIEVATGTYDYQTAIKRAIKDMAKNGISGATYKRNGKLVQYSLEGTVRRDTLTAVNKLANKSSETFCKELGAEYVEISSHLGARTHPTNPIANHAGWQGKVFKIDGSDKKYPNLKESTGYPDDILGLGGVNCRHRMFPFFPGISTPNPIRFNEEENRRVYELTQKQRAMERRMRQLKKEQAAAKEIGDKETVKKLNKKISEQSTKIDEFCKKNGLRRDHSRELVKEQITPKKNVAKSENSGIIEKKSNREVREWYISEVSNIPNTIDETLPLKEQARQAFEKRNLIRSKAREMMADKEMRNILETEKPNMTFDELIASKMKRKGLTRKEAQIDILKTATKTNKNVNKELGLDGD
nr:MAG TPA: minor capsid protein [Caudoviricetes sp.]